MSSNTSVNSKALVFNYTANTSSTDVIKFINEDLVIYLNSYEKFVNFYDAFTQDQVTGKYCELPKAAEPVVFTPPPDGNVWTIKGEFANITRKQAIVETWPTVAKQITAAIAATLNSAAKDKILEVFPYEWTPAILAGKVSKVMEMVKAGLTNIASKITGSDRLEAEKTLANFERTEAETTHDSNTRFLESVEQVKALGGDVPSDYKLLITYLVAQRKHYVSVNANNDIQMYLSKRMQACERAKSRGQEQVAMRDIMTELIDIEAQCKYFQGQNIPEIKAVSKVTRAKAVIKSAKSFKHPVSKPTNNTNPNTNALIRKWIANKKYKNKNEALAALKCKICGGPYHIASDCNNSNDDKKTPRTPQPDKNNYTQGFKREKGKQVYQLERRMPSVEEAIAALEFHNNNNDAMVMMLQMQHKPTTLVNDYKWRYNLDNHCNILVFNNSEIVSNIAPVTTKVNGYSSQATLKWSCVHPIFGKGYYDPQSEYNLLGQSALNKAGFFEHKRKEDRDMLTTLWHEKWGDIVFKRHRQSDFYSISHQQLNEHIRSVTRNVGKFAHNSNIAFPTMHDTNNEYSDAQIKRAEEVISLHRKLGHPSFDNMKKLLDHNMLTNTYLTGIDVARAQRMFGNCDVCTAAKPQKVTNQNPTYEATVNTIAECIHIDIIFTNGTLPYLMAVEHETNHLLVEKMNKKDDISSALEVILAKYSQHGHIVKTIRCDAERVLISEELSIRLAQRKNAIKIRAAIPGEHEKLAEANVQRLRVKMRCIAIDLPYKLPKSWVHHLLIHSADLLNMIPNAKLQNRSPMQLIEGRKPNYLTDIPVAFGAAVLASNTTDTEKLHANYDVGIALHRSTNQLGGTYVWVKDKNIAVKRIKGFIKYEPKLIRDIESMEQAVLDNMVKANTNSTIKRKLAINPPPAKQPRNDNGLIESNNQDIKSVNDTSSLNNAPNGNYVDNNNGNNIEADNNSTSKPQENHNVRNNEVNDKDSQHNSDNNQTTQPDNTIDNTKPTTPSIVPDTVADNNTNASENSANTNNKTTHNYGTRSRVKTIMTLIENNHHNGNDDKAGELAADYIEMKQLLDNKVFKFLHSANEREKSIHTNILPSSMIRKVKYLNGEYLKHKSRLTAGGHRVDHDNYTIDNTSAPTVAFETIMIQVTVAAHKKLKIASIDFTGAYLNAPATPGRKHIMRLNQKISNTVTKIDKTLKQYLQNDNTMIVQLEKQLYGLPEAGHQWYHLLCNKLKQLGFISCIHEPTLFKRGDDIITVHVDDLLITYSNDELLSEIMNYFQNQNISLTMRKLQPGKPLEHLGVIIAYNNDGIITLSQQNYIQKEILDVYPFRTTRSTTPAGILSCDRDESDDVPIDKNKYLQKLMKLYYVAAHTRPDILTAVSYASVTSTPTTADDNKLDRIITYLANTNQMIMHISPGDLELFAHFDASFAIHDDMKSHSGKIIYLGKVPVYVKSSKQKQNAKSSTQAELNSLYEGLDTVLWCRAVLDFIDASIMQSKPTNVYQDNTSAILLSQMGKSANKSNTRFVNIRLYWIKDLLQTNQVNIEYMPTDKMIADALASIRQGHSFNEFRNNLNIH